MPSCSRGSSEGEELHYTEAWSTGLSQATPATTSPQLQSAVADLKARGNAAFKAGVALATLAYMTHRHLHVVPLFGENPWRTGQGPEQRTSCVAQAMRRQLQSCTRRRCAPASATPLAHPAVSIWLCC